MRNYDAEAAQIAWDQLEIAAGIWEAAQSDAVEDDYEICPDCGEVLNPSDLGFCESCFQMFPL